MKPKVVVHKRYGPPKGQKDIRCPCGGQVMVDAEVYDRLPFGFGFRAGVKGFVVDMVEKFAGWRGVCLECGKQGTFK